MARKKKETLPDMDNTVVDISSQIKIFDKCEWCFQFDEDDPYVFAAGETLDITNPPHVNIKLDNSSESNIEFNYNGKKFKLFAREMTDAGRNIIKKTQ